MRNIYLEKLPEAFFNKIDLLCRIRLDTNFMKHRRYISVTDQYHIIITYCYQERVKEGKLSDAYSASVLNYKCSAIPTGFCFCAFVLDQSHAK